MNTNDYLQLYDLEGYLLDTVRPRFHAQGYLSVFDFFCIIIWKANRMKSITAKRLLAQAGSDDLGEAVHQLTAGIYRQASAKDRLRYLFEEWKIWLPTASAILTILYPDEFTVYDARVCAQLGDFQGLNNIWAFEKLWDGYLRFRDAVIQAAPEGLSLRDKDRYLWARSYAQQLESDLASNFNKKIGDDG
jgi:hypothetical protein